MSQASPISISIAVMHFAIQSMVTISIVIKKIITILAAQPVSN
jgi:hypothetical protein